MHLRMPIHLHKFAHVLNFKFVNEFDLRILSALEFHTPVMRLSPFAVVWCCRGDNQSGCCAGGRGLDVCR